MISRKENNNFRFYLIKSPAPPAYFQLFILYFFDVFCCIFTFCIGGLYIFSHVRLFFANILFAFPLKLLSLVMFGPRLQNFTCW